MPLLRIPGALGRYAGGMTDIVVGAASVAETLAEATAAALEVDHTLTPLVVAGGAVHGIASGRIGGHTVGPAAVAQQIETDRGTEPKAGS